MTFFAKPFSPYKGDVESACDKWIKVLIMTGLVNVRVCFQFCVFTLWIKAEVRESQSAGADRRKGLNTHINNHSSITVQRQSTDDNNRQILIRNFSSDHYSRKGGLCFEFGKKGGKIIRSAVWRFGIDCARAGTTFFVLLFAFVWRDFSSRTTCRSNSRRKSLQYSKDQVAPLSPIPDWFVDVDKKVESLTALKSYLKRNDVDVS